MDPADTPLSATRGNCSTDRVQCQRAERTEQESRAASAATLISYPEADSRACRAGTRADVLFSFRLGNWLPPMYRIASHGRYDHVKSLRHIR